MTSDQPVVHGGLGQLCELSCLVYADPEAEVVWYRDTMRLDPSERRWDTKIKYSSQEIFRCYYVSVVVRY